MPQPVTLELLSTGISASCHSSATEKEVIYEQIARDIDMMEKTIFALKKRHNSLCIVERLPKELLATIYKWTLSMERDSRSCKWLRVGQVCTEWRRVALDCPALWCFHRSTNLNWIDIVFRRSGTLPLYVDQDLYRKNSKGLRQALSEIKRVRELAFTAYYTKQWKKIFEALIKLQPGVLPLLDSFNAHWGGYGNVPTLPGNLFTSTPPRLKSLTLSGCMIGNNTSLLPNLTSLALEQSFYDQESLRLPVYLAQLIGILEQAPKLENLKLHHACQEDDVGDIMTRSKIKTVQLSCLRHIDLAGLMCNVILSQITHSTPLARIVLQLETYPSRGIAHSMPKLCSTLANRIRPIHHLYLQVIDAYGLRTKFQYKFWGQDNLSIDTAPSATPDLNLTFYTDKMMQMDHSFMETISLASLQVLDIAIYIPTTVGFWFPFKDLENLTTIRVKNLAVVIFLQALKEMSHMKVDTNTKLSSRCRTKPSFKSLRILILQEWSFDLSTINKLLKCLAVRRRCGAKLQQLQVTESTFSGSAPTDIVAKLRKNVKEVTWDVKIETIEPHNKSNPEQDTQSISSNEVARWDYSSPEENFPFSPDEDDSD